jgi:TolB-like protein
MALLARPGQVVSRPELALALWGSDTFVDAGAGLYTAVAKLREALEDGPERPVFIETVPKRGYRFIGTIAPSKSWKRGAAWIGVPLLLLAAVGGVALSLSGKTRVAVVLFDNETDRPELARLAQGLTDATVFELTAHPELNVVGNAAVLRTARPFRDLERVRDTLDADFVVIGQVQTVDEAINVRAHLIRGSDLAHVWVDNVKATAAGEAALQAEVAGRIAAAVARASSSGGP